MARQKGSKNRATILREKINTQAVWNALPNLSEATREAAVSTGENHREAVRAILRKRAVLLLIASCPHCWRKIPVYAHDETVEELAEGLATSHCLSCQGPLLMVSGFGLPQLVRVRLEWGNV